MRPLPNARTRTTMAAALLCVACQSAGTHHVSGSKVTRLVVEGSYAQAVELARQESEAAPDDPQANRMYRYALAAALLEQGRRLAFVNDDDQALEHFNRALAYLPGQPEIQEWIQKTQDKIAERWFVTGRKLLATDELNEARDAFMMSLKYQPDQPLVRDQIVTLNRRVEYRQDLSETYYNEGISNLRIGELHVANSRFGYSRKYDEENERVERRITEVEREIARRFVAKANQLQANGFYSAARVEFHTALTFDPNSTLARTGYDAMSVESGVMKLCKSAEMWLLRGDWSKAVEALTEARGRTVMQHEEIDLLMGRIDSSKDEATYQLALNLEHDFRYEQAIVEYQRILDDREYYKDARARVDTLSANVERAKELYGTLEAIEDPEQRLEVLRQIDIIWPEYRDTGERIDALQGGRTGQS